MFVAVKFTMSATGLARQAESDGLTVDIQAFVRFLAQRAFAALRAIWLRCRSVIVSSRRLPPMRPPFRPISAITCEIRRAVGGGVVGSVSVSATDTRTTRLAFWTVSRRGFLLVRFGMGLRSHGQPASVKLRVFQIDPLPNRHQTHTAHRSNVAIAIIASLLTDKADDGRAAERRS